MLELKRELKPMNFMSLDDPWVQSGKEICCLEENKSFQPSLSSRTCLSEETGHIGFIRCRSSGIH